MQTVYSSQKVKYVEVVKEMNIADTKIEESYTFSISDRPQKDTNSYIQIENHSPVEARIII